MKSQPAQEMYELMDGEAKLPECGPNHNVKSTGDVDCSFYAAKSMSAEISTTTMFDC